MNSCPICAAPGVVVRVLSARFLRAALESYFGEPTPDGAVTCSYSIARCPECTLEYAIPASPGNHLFYSWITDRHGYYPEARWEWEVVLRTLRASPGSSLLEVGCGSGVFLERAVVECAAKTLGVDLTPAAVERCRSRGLEARCCTLQDLLSDSHRTFDFVVAFHCLEHVAQPLEFVRTAATALTHRGRLFLSTPYSPMSFENAWFDPLNHPPHHLTRWNERAYQRLAEMLGLRVSLHMPRPAGAALRAYRATRISWDHTAAARADTIRIAAARPLAFALELVRQLRRPRVNGVAAADVVLAEFSAR